MKFVKQLLIPTALAAIVLIGCGKDGDGQKKPVGNDHSSHHDHDHHIHGPMKGEVFDLGDSGIRFEVAAKYGQNLIIVGFLESDAKTVKKVKCTSVVGKLAAKADEEFKFEAMDSEGELTSRFEIENQDFAIARKTVGFKLHVEVDGKKYEIDIPKDPHG